MLPVVTVMNYAAWFVFAFIGVVWLLVLLQNRERIGAASPKAKRFPFVSIVVPAFNEERHLAACLRSLLALEYPKGKREVIVVDDASSDGTSRVAKGFPVKLLVNARNQGKAASLNRGIAAARGELIATVDADSTVSRSILGRMVGHFEDPQVGSVTPSLKVLRPRTLLERVQAAEYALNIFLRKTLALLDSIHVTPGVFSMYRASALRQVRGFDAGNLTEDMEIALRLHDAGWRIENAVDAVSYTVCPQGLRELYRQRLRWYRGALQNTYRYKHMLFNRAYGNLGVFFLPTSLISILVIIALFGFLAYGYGVLAAQTLGQYGLIGWDLSQAFAFQWPERFELLLPSTAVLFSAIGFAMGGAILAQSYRTSGQRGNRLGAVLYLAVFPVLMMAFWAAALAAEAVRAPKKW